MNTFSVCRRARLGTALAALALSFGSFAVATPAVAQSRAARPSETLTLSQNTGTLVRLSVRCPTCSLPMTALPTSVRSSTSSISSARAQARRPYTHGPFRPGCLCSQCPRQHQCRFGRRDAALGDAERVSRRRR